MNPWIFLAWAIALEVSGTFLLKLSNGFEKWQWGALSIFCYSACFWVLAPAMKALPADIGTSDGIRQALKLLSKS